MSVGGRALDFILRLLVQQTNGSNEGTGANEASD